MNTDSFERQINSIIECLENSQDPPKQKYTLSRNRSQSVLQIQFTSDTEDGYVRVSGDNVHFVYMSKNEFSEFIHTLQELFVCDYWSVSIDPGGSVNLNGLQIDSNKHMFLNSDIHNYEFQSEPIDNLEFGELSKFTEVNPADEELQMVYSMKEQYNPLKEVDFERYVYIFEEAAITIQKRYEIRQHVFCVPKISFGLDQLKQLDGEPVETEIMYMHPDIESQVLSYMI